MMAHVADTLTMTGRRLLRLERLLRRTARLAGTMATYQTMLSNPLSRFTALLDSLALSSGLWRVAAPIPWRPSDAMSAAEPPPSQRYAPAAPSAASEVARNDASLAQPVHTQLVQSWIEPQALATSLPQETLAFWPEAYLLSSYTGGRPPARQSRVAMPMVSDLTAPATRRNEAEPSDGPLSYLSSSPQREHVMTEWWARISSDDTVATSLPAHSPPPSLRPGRRRTLASVPRGDQPGKALPSADGSRDVAPAPNDQQRPAQPTNSAMGSVRLSRGGASLLSILRHNLTPGQSPSERLEPVLSQGSPPLPEGDDQRPGSTDQADLGHGVRQGSLMQRNDAPDAWGRDEASQQLSPEQIEQIMDTLAAQLELSLLRTYGTSRR